MVVKFVFLATQILGVAGWLVASGVVSKQRSELRMELAEFGRKIAQDEHNNKAP